MTTIKVSRRPEGARKLHLPHGRGREARAIYDDTTWSGSYEQSWPRRITGLASKWLVCYAEA
jgi:hypothetical protein